MSKRFVFVNGVELTPANYESLVGYGTSLERAVNNACDAFYDGTTEDERAAGILTKHGLDKILIKEAE